jgi:hypothetical protein
MVKRQFRLLDAHITITSTSRAGNFQGWRVRVKMDDGRTAEGFCSKLTIQEAMDASIKFIPTRDDGQR